MGYHTDQMPFCQPTISDKVLKKMLVHYIPFSASSDESKIMTREQQHKCPTNEILVEKSLPH